MIWSSQYVSVSVDSDEKVRFGWQYMRLRRLMMNHEDKFSMWDIKTPLECSYLRDLILGRVEITGTPSDET